INNGLCRPVEALAELTRYFPLLPVHLLLHSGVGPLGEFYKLFYFAIATFYTFLPTFSASTRSCTPPRTSPLSVPVSRSSTPSCLSRLAVSQTSPSGSLTLAPCITRHGQSLRDFQYSI